jgi:tetratricopeptide (TPR) repeat protein
MTVAVMMTDCPTPETLAAFVDGRLNAAEREEVMKHLADCAECRDTVLLATEIAAAEAPKVVRPRFRPRVWAPLAAAAAAVVVLFGVPQAREGVFGSSGRRAVVEDLKSLEKRQTEARISYDDGYKEFKGRPRGEPPPPELIVDKLLIDAEVSVENYRSPANLHALGIALLVAGKRDEAIKTLEGVASTERSTEVLNDLAAAYLERDHDGDYERALQYANEALERERTPAGLWNRALALERLGRDKAGTIKAWQEYIAAETDAKWKQEAKDRIASLRELT